MFLGIDLGTSEVRRSSATSRATRRPAPARRSEVQRPHPRWSEQSPEAWWEGPFRGRGLRERTPSASPPSAASASPARCTAPPCSSARRLALRPAMSLERRALAARNCLRSSSRGCRPPPPSPATSACRVTAPKLILGGEARARGLVASPRSCFPGLPAPALTGDKCRHVRPAGTLWLASSGGIVRGRMLEGCRLSPRAHAAAREGSDAGTPPPEIAARGHPQPGDHGRRGWRHAASAVGIGAVAPGDASSRSAPRGAVSSSTIGSAQSARAPPSLAMLIPRRWHQMSVISRRRAACAGSRDSSAVQRGGGARRGRPLDEQERARAPIFCLILPASGRRTTIRPRWAASSASRTGPIAVRSSTPRSKGSRSAWRRARRARIRRHQDGHASRLVEEVAERALGAAPRPTSCRPRCACTRWRSRGSLGAARLGHLACGGSERSSAPAARGERARPRARRPGVFKIAWERFGAALPGALPGVEGGWRATS